MHALTSFGPYILGENPFDASFEVNSLDAQVDDLTDVLFASRGAAERVLLRQREIAAEDVQDAEFFDFAEHYEIHSLQADGFPDVFRIVDQGRDGADIAMLVFDLEEAELMREVLIRSCEIEKSILEVQLDAMREMSLFRNHAPLAA